MLIGPQGSGKSTQAQLLAKALDLPKISTGEIFRKLAGQNSSLSQRIKKTSEAGQLIDDETTCQIVKSRLTEPGLEKGFILDGYPRSLEQVKIFDPQVDKVLYINVSENEVIDRMMKRGRPDDTASSILVRLDAYYKKTQPLLDYYRNLGILQEIDGVGTIAEIQTRIFDSLELI